MLQSIRDRAQGWIFGTIIVLLMIPFAFWGINQYFGTDPNIAVAEVEGVEIPLSEYQKAYQEHQSALRAQLGNRFDPDLFDERVIKRQAIEALVRDQIVLNYAREAGLRVSDEQLARAIRRQPQFQREGRFSRAAYEDWLGRIGYSSDRFEAAMRRNLIEAQLQVGLGSSEILTDSELRRLLALQGEKRRFLELVLDSARFAPEAVDEADIRAYYEANRARFVTPEQVRLAYVVVDKEALAGSVSVDEEALRSLYESRKASFMVPEQRRVRHILVASEGKDGDERALEKARRLRERILAGEPFEEVARAESDDIATREQGGDLQFLIPGLMDPAFEKVAFSLPPGEVSEPVRTPFGYHLIEVTEVRPARGKSFEEARAELEQEYRAEQAEERYFEIIDQLANLTFEHPDTLEVAAEALDLEVKRSPLIDRTGLEGDPVLGDARVLGAAFDEDVLEGGNNSDIIDLDGVRAVVVRVEERRPPRQRALEEVREEVAAAVRAERAREAARKAGEEAVARLRAGEDRQRVAESLQGTWRGPLELARASREQPEDVPGEVRSLVFQMPEPPGEGVVYDGVQTADGDYVVVALEGVSRPEPDAIAGEQVQALRRQLASITGQDAYEAFVRDLRRAAEVRIFEDRL